MRHVIGALLAAGAALALTPLVRRLADRTGVVDAPGARKLQERAMPLLGGLAVLIAAGLGWLAIAPAAHRPSWLAALAFLLAATAGLADDVRKDRFPTGAKSLVLALAALAAGFALRPGGCAADVLLAALWFFVVVNASNLCDNANGLSAGLAATPYLAVVLAGGAGVVGEARAGALGCAAGAALGFLPFNFPRARIFLGDLGAYGLGAILALALDPFVLGALAPALLAVPLVDLIWVGTRRLALGLRPWQGDRRHLSHQLMARGASEAQAVSMLWAAALAAGWVGVWLAR